MSVHLETWYGFVLLQMASESYLETVDLLIEDDVKEALQRGNNREGFPAKGVTQFTDLQAEDFVRKFQIIAQASDYPDPNRTTPVYYAGTNILANTGMSATLIQKRGTNEFTLAIRSTESRFATNGGDFARDLAGADYSGIVQTGFALAQQSALEDYYRWLKENGRLPAGARLTVTGYSLGGHLATVFTEIHAGDTDVTLDHTYTFNGAGRGTWSRNASSPGAIVDYYKAVLLDPEVAAGLVEGLATTDARRVAYMAAKSATLAGQPLDPLSVYADPRHEWAQMAAKEQFGLARFGLADLGSSDLRNDAAAKITQIYGQEFPNASRFVANTGVHGPVTGVFVEAQPVLEISPDTPTGATDYGNAHSIVLIADSLAVMRLYQTLDFGVTLDTLNRLFAAASNKVPVSGTNSKAEDDPLENMLDALRRLFLGPDVRPTAYKPGGSGFGNFDARNGFHNNVAELAQSAPFAAWAGQARIADLTTLSAAEMLGAAQLDIAYRYALKELNPFALLDATALYSTHNAAGQLDHYVSADSTPSGMTDLYLTDLATFLAWKNLAFTSNVSTLQDATSPTSWRYIDVPLALTLGIAGAGAGSASPEISRWAVFGGNVADGLIGGTRADRLYGAAGTDFLNGKAENDYLEGGAGLDVYDYRASTTAGFIESNDGEDTIRDTDGKGVLRYRYTNSFGSVRSTVIADASIARADGTWRSADGTFKYEKVANEAGRTDLVITIVGDVGGKITLKDFRDGDFGIRPRLPRATPQYAPTSNVVPGGDESSNALFGTGEADLILAFGGGDRIEAGAGDDIAEGGSGDDVVLGEDGRDRLYGDAGRDRIDGAAGDDELYGGLDADILEGRDGADLLAGQDGADVIAGDAGDDEIHGSELAALADAVLLSETQIASGLRGDWVDGGEGDDIVIGAVDDDQVMGGGGADVLVGGAGDDNLVGDTQRTLVNIDTWSVSRVIVSSQGSVAYQLIYNADAQVEVSANGAGDAIYGGAGTDWIFGGTGDDFIDAGSGADIAFGEADGDVLIGGPGDDLLIGDNPGVVAAANEGGDYLDGGAGNDTLHGNGGEDVLAGGPGDDTLFGGAGKDIYLYDKGDGSDVVIDLPAGAGDPEASILVLGDGISRGDIKFIPGSLGIDLGPSDPADPSSPHDAIHFEGFDRLDPFATPVLDLIQFADGSTMSFAEILAQGFDIDGTEEDDDGHDAGHPQLRGTAVTDRIRGFAGADQLFGFAGDDVLSGGDGSDALVGDEGDDALAGDAGTDSLWGGAGNDALDGGSGNDILYGNEGADTLDGGAGDDTLYAHTFVIVDGVPMLNPLDDDAPDVLRGGDGDDYLNAGGGDDVLAGGAGVDVLEGGAGADFYVFDVGDAQDTIFETDDAAFDKVVFGSAIAPSDLALWQTGADLVVGHANGADTLTIANWYAGAQYQVSEFEFGDGTVWSAVYANDEGAKTKRGTAGNDTISGGAIDETISGLAGNDQLFGNAGADTLAGGSGNDTLNGGSGADTYRFELGDGRDVVQESGQGSDTLVFGAGIAKAELQLARSGNDLVLAHANGADSVTVKDWFNDLTKQLESISFAATGESFSSAELTDPFLTISGTANADFLSGGDLYGETILGLAGDDELHGGAGDDSLTGGLGNDRLFGEGGNDRYYFAAGDGQDVLTDPTGLNVIQFGPNLANKLSIAPSGFDQLISFTGTADSVLVKAGGSFPTLAFEVYGTSGADSLAGSDYKDIVYALGGNDSVNGGPGVDEIHGGPGNDALEGGRDIDELWGDEGDDLLDGDLLNDPFNTEGGYITRFHGGPGNDTLYGSTKEDSYYFDLGDGQDTVVDEPFFGNGQWHYSLSDELVFGAGIAPDAIGGRASGGDLIVDVSATDRVTLRNWLSDPKYRVDRFRFSDGSTMNEAEIADLVNVRQGTAGDDVLTGTDTGNERLYGRAGNDSLSGLSGDDLLDGGTGNDTLAGGAGNDTYVVRPGDGSDLVRESGGADAIQFAAGVSAGEVALERSANNLLLRLPGGGDTVAVENFLKDPGARVETFLFTDGSSLPDAEAIVEQLAGIRGTASDDDLTGTAYADRLYGMEGNDTLSGGADDDLLAGGAGTDLYRFNPGDANDTISDPDSANLVQFGAGITPQNTITTRTGDDLVLAVSGTADRLSVPGYFLSYPVAEFRFGDGTVWTVDTIKAKVTTATSGADTLIGFESNDSLSGLAGNDLIYGRGGDDTLDGGLGSDTLHGEDGNDTLIGGTGEAKNASVSNSLYGGNGDDVLIGGGNAKSGERLDGGPGADLLLGGIAQEIIDDTGYDGRNSLLFGGAGADTMRMYGGASALAIGGAGNDRISGGLGAGVAKTRMIVAFNKADGVETVDQLAPGSTITIGGGTLYSNLSLEVSGSGLRLKTGSSHYIYLSDWYSGASGAGGRAVSTLQIVIEGTRDYKASSSNPMNNRKIQVFDFLGLVAAFDAARAAGQNFSVAANLANFRLSGSDTEAIGGALAYQYARTGTLGTLTHDQMREVINAPGFASAPQPISASAPASQEASASEESLAAAEFTADPGTAWEASIPRYALEPVSSEDRTASADALSAPRASVLEQRIAAAIEDGLEQARDGQPLALSAFDDIRSGDFGSDQEAPDPLAVARAWRRIARDLPVHLERYAESGLGASAWFPSLTYGASLLGASAQVIPAVGLAGAARDQLRPLEGLSEGLRHLV